MQPLSAPLRGAGRIRSRPFAWVLVALLLLLTWQLPAALAGSGGPGRVESLKAELQRLHGQITRIESLSASLEMTNQLDRQDNNRLSELLSRSSDRIRELERWKATIPEAIGTVRD